MTQEELNQWITALESGEYRQGQGIVYNPRDDTSCPLGVLMILREKRLGAVEFFINYYPLDVPISIRQDIASLNDDYPVDNYQRVIQYLRREDIQSQITA